MIDPKALTKDQLYGNMDATTRERKDGVFTSILRKILDNARGGSASIARRTHTRARTRARAQIKTEEGKRRARHADIAE